MIMLAIFLLAIATASASDAVDTVAANEEDSAIELSDNDEIIAENTKDNIQKQSSNDESVKDGSDVVGVAEGTYSDLKNEIGNGGNINLTKSYYRYNNLTDANATTIKISVSGTIDGKGAVIDMNGSHDLQTISVSASGVTIKNLTIQNANCGGSGAAISFFSSFNLIDSNFYNNRASGGGALYINTHHNVLRCNFANNYASNYGGAIQVHEGGGSISYCNFTNNRIDYKKGGAIYRYQYGGEVYNLGV